MAWPLIAAAAMSTAETVGNNLMSEWHADKAQERQKELANIQFSHNQGLQRAAMANQVQGAKLAGLNPAMFNGQMSPAQSVSQGSAPKGENVEMNQTSPVDMLTMAQVRNLEAQTDKTEAETNKISGVDTENIKSDTALKIAQAAFADAGKEKIGAETQNIQNINEQYSDANRFFKDHGKSVADDWKKSNWYVNGNEATKSLVDKMADGSIPLSVGTLKALNDTVQNSNNLSKSDKENYLNAIMDVVYKTQFENDEVLDAMAELPRDQQKKIRAEVSKIYKELKEIASRTHLNYEYADTEELRRVNMDAERRYTQTKTSEARKHIGLMSKESEQIDQKVAQMRTELESFITRDLGINRKEGDVTGWLLTMFENIAGTILAIVGAGKAASIIKGSDKMHTPVSDQKARGETFYKEGLSDWTSNPRNHEPKKSDLRFDGRKSPFTWRERENGSHSPFPRSE